MLAACAMRSFEVLHLLAELLDHALQLEADIGQFDVVRLGAQRIGFAVEFLRQEIEPAPDRRRRRPSACAPARRARRAGRVPRGYRPCWRAGSPPGAAGRDRSGRAPRAACAICSASRFLIASGWRPGAASARADERRDLVEPRRQDCAERLAFVPAHRRESPFSAVDEAGDDRGFGGASLLLGLLCVVDLDHALERRACRRAAAVGIDLAGRGCRSR